MTLTPSRIQKILGLKPFCALISIPDFFAPECLKKTNDEYYTENSEGPATSLGAS